MPSLTFTSFVAYVATAGLWVALHGRLRARWLLLRATHPAWRMPARLTRALAQRLPPYSHDPADFFSTDGSPRDVALRRRAAFTRLSELLRARSPKTLALSARVEPSVSDRQFLPACRVPAPYGGVVREQLKTAAFVAASHGVMLTDLDGNDYYDLSGDCGVKLLDYDFYKQCLERGFEQVRVLGPVLGPYHPLVERNVARLRQISGLDAVSFHLSGAEALLQAVALARYHTRKAHVVRFSPWDGDSEARTAMDDGLSARGCYRLAELHDASLGALRASRDIACAIVDPMQALHPNTGIPTDAQLHDSSRRANFERAQYKRWLEALRAVCSERNIALIFDERLSGFRLAFGGAQAYFGVQADFVIYGNNVGGGLPVGVVCGRKPWMAREEEDGPGRTQIAAGRFDSHPYVMACMHEFLEQLERPALRALYAELDGRWDARAQRLNQQLCAEDLPVRVANLASVWTVCYLQASRYNWMLQYYLRAEGIALGPAGTGRMIWAINCSERDAQAVIERFVGAARRMHADGFWWSDPTLTDRAIRARALRERFARQLPTLGQRMVLGAAARAAARHPESGDRV